MRSKTLLVSNMFSTVYSAWLLYTLCKVYGTYGGYSFFKSYYELLNMLGHSWVSNIITFFVAHVAIFVVGSLFGWIAYLSNKSGTAKFAAFLYLAGTICFPIYFMFGIPLIIIGFITCGKQKKINMNQNIPNL